MKDKVEIGKIRFCGEEITLMAGRYTTGSLAVFGLCREGEPWGTLSVNFPESATLPPNCFYIKDWTENAGWAAAAVASGWFKPRKDLLTVISGFVWSSAWEVLGVKGPGYALDGDEL